MLTRFARSLLLSLRSSSISLRSSLWQAHFVRFIPISLCFDRFMSARFARSLSRFARPCLLTRYARSFFISLRSLL